MTAHEMDQNLLPLVQDLARAQAHVHVQDLSQNHLVSLNVHQEKKFQERRLESDHGPVLVPSDPALYLDLAQDHTLDLDPTPDHDHLCIDQEVPMVTLTEDNEVEAEVEVTDHDRDRQEVVEGISPEVHIEVLLVFKIGEEEDSVVL